MDVPLGVDAGETEPQEVTAHETAHLTPCPLVSLLTVAVKACIVLSSTTALLLETDRIIAGDGGVTGELPPHERLAAARIAAADAPTWRTQIIGDITAPMTDCEFVWNALGKKGHPRPKNGPYLRNIILPNVSQVKPNITVGDVTLIV